MALHFNQSEASIQFKDILREHCFVLSSNEDKHSITKEQSLVIREIEKYLDDEDEFKRNEKKLLLINGLKNLCSDEDSFKKALLPSLLQKEGMSIAIAQDSLIRLLLRINVLQDEVIELILDEVKNTVSLSQDNPSWLKLLLNPLRYLPRINKSAELTSNLLDILQIASEPIQLEILDMLPEILPDSTYNQAAKQLVTFLNSKEVLTGAIIDCLGSLDLDDDLRMEIKDIILLRILPGNLNNFPVLMAFLLENTKGHNVPLMFKIRDALDVAMSSNSNSKEKDSPKVLIFTKLKLFAKTRKQFVQDCLDIINTIKIPDDHKPFDLFLLLLLHTVIKSKKRAIELIFRKKVKENVFKCKLLEKLLKHYLPHQIFKDLFQSALDIGCNLIRTSEDPAVKIFSESLFKLLFAYKFAGTMNKREILDHLLGLAGANDKKYIGQVLSVLLVLIKEDTNKFKPHAMSMMQLLERMDSYDLDSIKGVYEILCCVTCTDEYDESMISMSDDIHMIIRKQLSSSKKHVKFRGIIGAVVMARYFAETNDEKRESESEESDTNSPPQGRPQKAAKLLEMASNRIKGCFECMGLFYDQLALMISTYDNLDKRFLNWLSEATTEDFMSSFILGEFNETQINEINYTEQYQLVPEGAQGDPIKVNIGIMAAKPEKFQESSVILLAPHFRLLRLLVHRRHNGDLSEIDALLCCPVILPDVTDIDDLDQGQLKQVTDSLFHCVNWFRELISAFVFMKTLRSSLVQRLHQLIDLEKQLNQYLSKIPEHFLPRSYFDSLSQNKQSVNDSKQKQPPAKRVKSKETAPDETIASTSALSLKEKRRPASVSSKSNQEFNVQFRELDPDFFAFLRTKLLLEPNEEGLLNIHTFTFILKDLVRKFHTVILGEKKTQSPVNTIRPSDFIKDFVKILPKLNLNFLKIKDKIQETIKDKDGCYDSEDMFTDEMKEFKICFGYILECYSIVLNWPTLQEASGMDLLKKILAALRSDGGEMDSISHLSAELLNIFEGYIDECLLIAHGVFLVKILRSLIEFSPNNKKKKKVSAVCKELLNRRWYNDQGVSDSGKKFFDSVGFLLGTFLDSFKVSQLRELVGVVLEEFEGIKSKNDHLTTLATIDLKNFHVFYQGLFNALHIRVKNEVQSLTNIGHLDLWCNTTKAMSDLMSIAKGSGNTVLLSTFLKKSIAILKIFLSHGIPIFEIMFSSHMDQVVDILKAMQGSTRFLHHLCCDSKMKKRVSLVPHIPHFRLMLEQFIYKVKALLAVNNCQNAFLVATLKNKDMEGNTQTSMQSEDASTLNGDEENGLPSDDEEVDENEQSAEEGAAVEDETKSDSDVFD